MHKILLIGDACIDIYKFGTIDRLNPEAPCPLFKSKYERQQLGMAANVELNLSRYPITVHSNLYHGCEKIRYIDERSNYQLLRVDNDIIKEHRFSIFDETYYDDDYSAIVISDYEKGFITDESIFEIENKFKCPIFLDSKKRALSKFKKCIIKINESEFISSDLDKGNKNLIVTLGKKGARYNNKIYPTDDIKVHDVCGAGDTFLSALVYKYITTEDMEESIRFANKAASITITKLGTYAPTLEEINYD